MWQVDGADQFASGYVGMGNNAVNGTDPDGQWVHIAIGAAIGGAINVATHWKQISAESGGTLGGVLTSGAFWKAFGVGAAAGAVTAATGGGALAATGLKGASIVGGAVAGASGAATGGLVQGVGNAHFFGDRFTARDWAIGVAAGGVLGGIGGGIANRIRVPKIGPTNIWTGKSLRDGQSIWSLRGGSGGHGGLGGEIISEFPDFIEPSGKVHKGGSYTTSGTGAVQTYYPPNGGAYGNWSSTILQRGQIIDRFGELRGSYFSPSNTPMGMRALPYDANLSKYTQFEVLKPFHVQQSKISAAFGEIGGRIQYKSALSADELIKAGVIKIVR